jgi:hypothetical protein
MQRRCLTNLATAQSLDEDTTGGPTLLSQGKRVRNGAQTSPITTTLRGCGLRKIIVGTRMIKQLVLGVLRWTLIQCGRVVGYLDVVSTITKYH